MEKILDFNCTFNSAAGIDRQIIEKLGLTFPDAYMKSHTLMDIAIAMKEANKAPLCILPLCHTIEGEAMGAHINYGSGELGPRAGKQICRKVEEILELPDIDFAVGRVAEVLEACRGLRERGENVVLELSGPFTILDTLADAVIVFRAMRKQPEVMAQVLEKIRANILAYFTEAQKSGVNLISYADSSGGVNILGPKLSEQIVEQFTYPLLKDMEKSLDNNIMVLLCPKTSFALLGTGKAQWEELRLSKPMTYGEACIESVGKVKFAGQMCIKNNEYMLEQGIFKEIKLL